MSSTTNISDGGCDGTDKPDSDKKVCGTIFDVQKFSLHDGPGIRTTVFLKGCPLRCAWCHNPESQNFQPELSFVVAKCIGCGACLEKCPHGCHGIEDGEHVIDRTRCTACGLCSQHCPTAALELIGRSVTVDEILAEVLRDEPFYKSSGGGMTISGGEPLAQPDFTYALLAAAQEKKIHTAVETSCYGPDKVFRKLAGVTDLFLVDYKATDSDDHKKYTNVDINPILENIKLLDSLGCSIILRCPIISPVNDTDEHFAGIASLANSLKNLQQIDLLAWHALGGGKYRQMGYEQAEHNFSAPAPEQKQLWLQTLQQQCSCPVSWL